MNSIMLEKELSFADLPISLSEIYETMGYADAVPDEAVEKEVRGVLGRVEAVTSPRFCFFISGGDLDETKDLLTVGKTSFSIGKIITRQLRPSLSLPRLPELALKNSSIRCNKRGIW